MAFSHAFVASPSCAPSRAALLTGLMPAGNGAELNHCPMRSIRTRDWKLILNLTPDAKFTTHIDLAPRENKPGNWGTYRESWKRAAESEPAAAAKVNRYHHRPAVELYDLTQDPHELQNLAQDPAQADRVRALRAELENWRHTQDYRKGGSGVSGKYLDAVEEAAQHDPIPDNPWA